MGMRKMHSVPLFEVAVTGEMVVVTVNVRAREMINQAPMCRPIDEVRGVALPGGEDSALRHQEIIMIIITMIEIIIGRGRTEGIDTVVGITGEIIIMTAVMTVAVETRDTMVTGEDIERTEAMVDRTLMVRRRTTDMMIGGTTEMGGIIGVKVVAEVMAGVGERSTVVEIDLGALRTLDGMTENPLKRFHLCHRMTWTDRSQGTETVRLRLTMVPTHWEWRVLFPSGRVDAGNKRNLRRWLSFKISIKISN